ncbi:hypothetical protein D9756_002875 [Leucocoprinus leucothites]|uniref:Uncharacterized protein n=1 Tax=Leucocoprinus leucothites TaxID=201217 RepID=A0A8H5LJK0_9AGAR|nr:hypothetical protein D9756_002875 [Leucoagaricus leucothites]
MNEHIHDQLYLEQRRNQASEMAYKQTGRVRRGHQNTIMLPDQPAELSASFGVEEGERNIIVPPLGDQSRTQYHDSFNVGKGNGNVIMSAAHPAADRVIEDALKLIHPSNTETFAQPTPMAQVVKEAVETVVQTVPSANPTSPKKSLKLLALLALLFRRKKKGEKQNKESFLSEPGPPAFGKLPTQLSEEPLPQVPRASRATETHHGELTLL